MVLRFQRVTPIVSPQRMRPDELGVTQGLQAPHRRGITAPSLSIFEMKPPRAACWEPARRFSSVCAPACGLLAFSSPPRRPGAGAGACHPRPFPARPSGWGAHLAQQGRGVQPSSPSCRLSPGARARGAPRLRAPPSSRRLAGAVWSWARCSLPSRPWRSPACAALGGSSVGGQCSREVGDRCRSMAWRMQSTAAVAPSRGISPRVSVAACAGPWALPHPPARQPVRRPRRRSTGPRASRRPPPGSGGC